MLIAEVENEKNVSATAAEHMVAKNLVDHITGQQQGMHFADDDAVTDLNDLSFWITDAGMDVRELEKINNDIKEFLLQSAAGPQPSLKGTNWRQSETRSTKSGDDNKEAESKIRNLFNEAENKMMDLVGFDFEDPLKEYSEKVCEMLVKTRNLNRRISTTSINRSPYYRHATH